MKGGMGNASCKVKKKLKRMFSPRAEINDFTLYSKLKPRLSKPIKHKNIANLPLENKRDIHIMSFQIAICTNKIKC